MPGAGRTRSLARKTNKACKHSRYRQSRKHPALPAQWFERLLRALLGVPGLLAPVALPIIICNA
jgi:hypothetical protein